MVAALAAFPIRHSSRMYLGFLIQSKLPLEMFDLLVKENGILATTGLEAIPNASETTVHLSTVSTEIDSGEGSVGVLINNEGLRIQILPPGSIAPPNKKTQAAAAGS